jgi:Transglycosylase SLT domain
MSISVPESYVSLLQGMSSATGIPYNVEAAQANEESGFNPNAVSTTGAEGWLQFEPSTYDAYANQAGVAQGTEFNPTDEAAVYDVYMKALLAQEGGSLFKALEAYNAGPGNLSAGASYANAILSAAGENVNTVVATTGSTSTTGTTATLDSFPGGGFDPLNWPSEIGGAASNAILGGLEGAAKKVGADIWAEIRPLLIRIGLILFGAFIVYAGINGMLKGGSTGPTQITVSGVKSAASKAKSK